MNGMALQLFGNQDYMKTDNGKETGRSGSIQTQISFESILNTKKTDMSSLKNGETFRDSFPEASQARNDQRRARWQDNAQATRLKAGERQNDYSRVDDAGVNDKKVNDDSRADDIKGLKDKSKVKKMQKSLSKKLETLEKAIDETTDPQIKKELETVAQEVKDLLQKLEDYAVALGNPTMKSSTEGDVPELRKEIIDGLQKLEGTIQTALKALNPNHTSSADVNNDHGNMLTGFGRLLGELKSTKQVESDSGNDGVDSSNEMEDGGDVVSTMADSTVEPLVSQSNTTETVDSLTMTDQVANKAIEQSTVVPTNEAVSTQLSEVKPSKGATEQSTVKVEDGSEAGLMEADNGSSSSVEVLSESQNKEGQQAGTGTGNTDRNLKSEEKAQVRTDPENGVKSIEISKFEPTLTKLSRAATDTPMKRFENNIMNQIQQLMNGTLKINKDSSSEMTLKLKPESLGEVSLKLALDADGQLKADFKVESLMIKSILEGHMNELKNALQEKGYQVSKFDVSLSDNGTQQQGKNNGHHGHSRGNGGNSSKQSEFEQEVTTRLRMKDETTTIDSLV